MSASPEKRARSTSDSTETHECKQARRGDLPAPSEKARAESEEDLQSPASPRPWHVPEPGACAKGEGERSVMDSVAEGIRERTDDATAKLLATASDAEFAEAPIDGEEFVEMIDRGMKQTLRVYVRRFFHLDEQPLLTVELLADTENASLMEGLWCDLARGYPDWKGVAGCVVEASNVEALDAMFRGGALHKAYHLDYVFCRAIRDNNKDVIRFARETLPRRVVAHRTTDDVKLAEDEIRKDMLSAAVVDTAVGYHAKLASEYVRAVEKVERVPREWGRLQAANARRPPSDQVAWDTVRNFVTTHLPWFAVEAACGGE